MKTTKATRIVVNPDEMGQDPRVGLKLAQRLGASGVELRTAFGANVIQLEAHDLRRLRDLVDSYSLPVVSVASPLFKWESRLDAMPTRPVDRFGFDTYVPIADEDMWVERAIEAAITLGASHLRIFSYLRRDPKSGIDRFIESPAVGLALDAARSNGIQLLLENELACLVDNGSRLIEALRLLGPDLGAWLDLGNLARTDGTSFSLPTELVDRVQYLHIKDYLPDGESIRFVPAGQGVVPILAWLNCLSDAHDPILAIETHTRDNPARGVEQSFSFLAGL